MRPTRLLTVPAVSSPATRRSRDADVTSPDCQRPCAIVLRGGRRADRRAVRGSAATSCATALGAPAEDLGGGVGELVEQRRGERAGERDARAPQHEVGQVHDALVAQEPRDLEARVVGVVLERSVAFALDLGEERLGPRAVALEELGGALAPDLVAVRHEPHAPGVVGRRIPRAAADRESLRRSHAVASDEPEHLVGEVLGEGAEGGPLPADEAQQRRARRSAISARSMR